MKNKKLPDPIYFNMGMLMDRWECDEHKIMHYVRTGQLKCSVATDGWHLEKGIGIQLGKDDWMSEPKSIYYSTNEILTLDMRSIKELLSCGEAVNPYFETLFDEYLCCSTNHYPSPHYPNVIIKASDLIFTQAHVVEFERGGCTDACSGYDAQLSDFINAPKPLKRLQDDILEDAMPIWLDFYRENRGEPSRKATVKLLVAKHPEKYGSHKASSLERHISLKALVAEFHKYKHSKD